MRAGEEERYVLFVQERHASLYRAAFLLTGNHHTAQDAVQSTLVKVYAKWSRVRRAERPVAYVQRMLANEVASMHRPRSAAEGPTPSSSLNSRSVASTWASAASTLPDTARLLTSSTWAPSL